MMEDDRVAVTSGADFWSSQELIEDGRVTIRSMVLTDGPHGVRRQPEDGDHLGLNEALPATCFPTASALGSTWDPQLLEEVGRALGREAREHGVDVLLGPGINIRRAPLGGRNFEYFSEDPVVSGMLGGALVRGVQANRVAACLKHFAVNNQETERMRVSADVDERTLREIYLRSFEIALEQGRPWTVMTAYNRINGVHASHNHWLITEVLRGEWGFDGLVVSDWGGVPDRPAALAAGLDLAMPGSTAADLDVDVRQALASGEVSRDALERAVANLRILADRTAAPGESEAAFDRRQHHELARRAAAQGTVLLKNAVIDGRPLLPLDPAAQAPVVIGELARTARYQGAGSSQVVPTQLTSGLEALGAAYGAPLRFAPGYRVSNGPSSEGDLLREAVDLATGASTVVLFLGLPPQDESEGYDRPTLELPGDQILLVEAVTRANPRVIVVLANGGVVLTRPWDEQVPVLVECWLGGQAGGEGVADVLTGKVNPSGRLTETVPLRLEDSPSFGNFPGALGHVRYGEGVLVGYRWYDSRRIEVAYPFGHGLSYSQFSYGKARSEVSGSGRDLKVLVGVDITCSSGPAGAEVVQLYSAATGSSVPRPDQELRAFRRVELTPGQSTRVEFVLGWRDLAFWDVTRNGWHLESGEVELRIGASSRDIRVSVPVKVEGDSWLAPVTPDSTLAEALRHPALHAALWAGVPEAGIEPLTDHLAAIAGDIPLRVIADFDGMIFGRPGLTHLLALAGH